MSRSASWRHVRHGKPSPLQLQAKSAAMRFPRSTSALISSSVRMSAIGVLSLLSGDGCLLDVAASVVSEDDRIGGVHRLSVACGERRRSVRVIVR